MNNSRVTIIDYGMGNLWSVVSSLKYLNCEVVVSADPLEIENAETLVLPGVGSFKKAMESLQSLRIDEAIIESVLGRGGKILGICLGMQLFGSASTEHGETNGLSLIPLAVDKFSVENIGTKKIPHIGFDQVSSTIDSQLFKGISENSDFYFVHSYRMLPLISSGKSAICNYGVDFLAAYENQNVFATQFHPEKSQTNGLTLLRNFLVA
jgi:glutamine amidotransferase